MTYSPLSVEVKSLHAQNIRSAMDGPSLDRLEVTMRKDGQKWPIQITSKFEIIDGHRRVDIARKLGWTHINAVVVNEELTPEQITDLQTIHAFHSEALSDFDRANALKAKKDVSKLNNKQLAEFYSIDPSEVTQLLALFGCIPAIQELAAKGKIGHTKWYAISQSSNQQATLDEVGSDATREEIKRSVKRARNTSTPAVRTKRLVYQGSSGVKVTVSGDETSLEEALESLQLAIKAIKKAIETGLDASTAQRVWADMAKAGA